MSIRLLFLSCLLSLDSVAARTPNFVYIVADDLGYADIGVHGCKDIPTPHMDSIAKNGIRFSSGYSNHTVCSPMRAGFLTGRYQHRFGYETNVAYDPQNPHIGLPDGERTISSRLKAAGYATAAIGKWHLGAHSSKHPRNRGFDFFYGFLGGGHDYFQADESKPYQEGYGAPVLRNGIAEGLGDYLTDRLSDEAAKWIGEQKEKPFFLYLAYNAPHTPMQAPKESLARFSHISDKKRRTYAAMVSEMDDGIGRVLKAIDDAKLRENTVVAFLSDNGGPQQQNASINTPLRGGKGTMFEGGIRVPFLLSWPGTLPAGKTDDRPVIALDLSVTALHLAQAPVDGKLDGANLMPYLTGDRMDVPVHEALFWRSTTSQRTDYAVRSGFLKLLSQNNEVGCFDLETDISEKMLLDAPATRERLQALWNAWNESNIPPAFPGFSEYHQRKDAWYEDMRTKR